MSIRKNHCWDTTLYPFNYDNEVKKKFNKEIINNRKIFTNWIGHISTKYKNDIDWWISAPPSRNPFISLLYKNICITRTFEKIINKDIFTKVIVDSKKLKQLLEKISKKTKKKIEIEYKSSSNKKINKISILKSLLFQTIIYFFVNIFIRRKRVNNFVVLIDLFYTGSDLSKNRHYGDLTINKFLSKKNFLFIPTFVMGSGIFNILKGILILGKNKNVIFKEHYISIFHIFKSCSYFFKIKKFKIRYNFFKGTDYSNLIFEEIKYYQDPNTIITAKINYLFIKNLKKFNFKVSKAINWFENQPVDRSWNYGFRKYFPKIKILGYQGFTIYPQYMCTHPSKSEEEAKVIPKEVVVIGKAFKKSRKEFFPKAKILVGPALNYQKIYKYSKKKIKKKIKLLVILSGVEHIDSILLNWTIELCEIKYKNIIMIKPHPNLPLNQIVDKTKLPKNLIKCQEDTAKLFQASENVVSCGPTSATLECLVYNCFLIVPVLDINDKISFKYLNISKNRFQIVNNCNEFISLLTKLLRKKSKKKNNNVSFNFKENLFSKNTHKNLKLFC